MIRLLARPLLASWFVYTGVSDVLEPARRAQALEPLVEPVVGAIEAEAGVSLPQTTATVARAYGAATALSAAVLALSRAPRTAGTVLTALAAVNVATSEPFWTMPEGPERDEATEKFLLNVALLGGAALAATAGHSAGHIKRKKARKVKAKKRKADAKAKQAAAAAKSRAKAGGQDASRAWWRTA